MTIRYVPIFFDDVDRFAAWQTGLGWQVESTQLTAGKSAIGFDHVAFSDLAVSHFTCRCGMYNEFELPEGLVLFVIARAKRPVIWRGCEIAPSILALVRPLGQHWVRIPDGWDCYEFLVSEDLVRRTELFPLRFFDRATDVGRALLPLTEPLTTQFIRRLDTVFDRVRGANGALESRLESAEVFDFIIGDLQRILDAGVAERGIVVPRSVRRSDLVPRARELVNENLGSAKTADEIAQTLGVSYRVLNYAIRDAFGMGPYRYFLTERLHAARRLLRASDSTVTEASFAFGFSNPGRFASQYERLFGELPSQTKVRR